MKRSLSSYVTLTGEELRKLHKIDFAAFKATGGIHIRTSPHLFTTIALFLSSYVTLSGKEYC
jgi:hypothetical protein